ncbi:exodeoxyribonuclease III [Sporohalobacter salinus]|uniref:exodeoxyribonuclease III n=1 Tax=Sporohalobacter salinus TaxID=1494606 RepID=UPI001961EFEA|nr:exodeoxyribonuclease III [Sporohalobacter salinus]MBM7625051.1 exodeoxyribonuclease-3 [Sporohalobacter salinus]
MEIYSWNVNGIRAVKRKGFLEWIEETKPDVLALQEIRIQPHQIPNKLENIDNYYSYFNCGDKKGYSGVALYTKEEPNQVEFGLEIDKFDREGRVLTAYYDDFTLLNIYFPNGRSSQERLDYKLDFYDAVFEYCQELRKQGHSLIISGDYNTAHHPIDLKNPDDNRNKSGFLKIEREWLDKLEEHDYVDTYREFNPKEIKYSWWSYRTRARERNAGWRIDYHFVTKDLMTNIINADVLTEVMGSDHCPVWLKIETDT